MTSHDRRITPARPDLAAAHLEGAIAAERYVTGAPARVIWPTVPLRSRPDTGAMLDTELVFGEPVTIYDARDGWVWLQSRRDGYVGYAPEAAFDTKAPVPTHRVAVLRTFCYVRPDMKGPTDGWLPLNARVAVSDASGPYARMADGRWVHAAHLSPLAHRDPDPVAVALTHVGVPYLWGGRTSLGLDCSGLVQSAYEACGRIAPRDSDMQAAMPGVARPIDLAGLARGDLIFWKGHVAMATSAERIVHANGHHMLVVEESVDVAVQRIAAKSFGAVTLVLRLDQSALPALEA